MGLLFSLICSADVPEQPARSVSSLLLEYMIYAAIIVVGIIVLILIKRKTKLPSHAELERRLSALSDSLEVLISLAEAKDSSYDFIRSANKLVYTCDKLAYLATLVSEKERDNEIGSAALQLEQCGKEISRYRFGLEENEDSEGLYDARTNLSAALDTIRHIIKRDNELKDKRAKRNNG